MNVILIFIMLLIHWFGDFVLQTDEQAKNKSSSDKALTEHVFTYTLMWVLPATIGAIYYNSGGLIFFPAITLAAHWITDYFTSRLNKKLYEKGKIHEFFVSIGFDQILHYTQLILTFKLLT